MKITPLEIRQKTFEKSFRGIDKDEVQAFLLTLSQQWDKLLEENRTLKTQLDKAEQEAQRLREVEGSLFRTLKTAEDMGQNITEEAQRAATQLRQEAAAHAEKLLTAARREAETVLMEARTESDKLTIESKEAAEKRLTEADADARRQLNEAQTRATQQLTDLQREQERSKAATEARVKQLDREHEQLQQYLDALMDDMRGLANAALQKVDEIHGARGARAANQPATMRSAPEANTIIDKSDEEAVENSDENDASADPSLEDFSDKVVERTSVKFTPVLPSVNEETGEKPENQPASPPLTAEKREMLETSFTDEIGTRSGARDVLPEITPPAPDNVPQPAPPAVEPIKPDITPPPAAPPMEPIKPEITPTTQPEAPEPLPAPSPAPEPMKPTPQPMGNAPASAEKSFFDEI